jgi:methionyl-tRNA formyltransferase
MRIIFWGTPEFAVPTLRRLLAEPEFEVLGVVTQPDKRRGRGNQLSPSPIKQVALEHDLPVWQPKSVKKDPETLEALRSLSADCFVVVAYGQILSQEILDMPRLGCVNNHGSLLPKYRGAAPIQWALYHGETETGITTMLMDAGMDTGAMLLKASLPIGLLDSAAEVSEKLANIAADLLIQTLQGLEQNQIQPIPQDSEQATYAPLIKKPDYVLNWSRPAIALHNQIRGFYPDCQTTFRDSPVKITGTVPLTRAYSAQLPPQLADLVAEWEGRLSGDCSQPGTVVGIAKKFGPIVQTGQGLLLLQQLQPAGKRLQSGEDFANGVRLVLGEFFGEVAGSN